MLLDLLLHEEPVDGLLPPHELDDQPVQVDEQSPAEATGDAAERRTESAPSRPATDAKLAVNAAPTVNENIGFASP